MRRRHGRYLVAGSLLVFGFAALALLVCVRHPPPVFGERTTPEIQPADRIEAERGDLNGFNVLIVTTDTTRADHIGCYGSRDVETPVIDRLARDGVLFANATTPSPSTLPAHASLMTGLYPHHHGARANGTFRLSDQVTTLAERLRKAGYRTGAVISSFVLDSRFGLDQGFDLYHDDLTNGMKYSPHMFRERAAELTNETAIEWLRQNGDEPFFLWVHYFDPHAVYLPPEPFRSRYAGNPYGGEIAYADSRIGELLVVLDGLQQGDRTLVVYTSDHGEGLGEHGERTHSLFVYDATMKVPLIFYAPSGLPRGKVIQHPVGLVDVAPTVLALLGRPTPQDLDGMNLLGPVPPSRAMVIETAATLTLHGWAPLIGLRNDNYKYILAPTPELYDLEQDPGELRNLHEDLPQVASKMRDELLAAVPGDALLSGETIAPSLLVDDETRRRLEGLGYIQTVVDSGTESSPRPDPKDVVPRYERLQEGIHLRLSGKVRQALPIVEAYVHEVEGDIFARQILAGIYSMRGDIEKAQEIIDRSAELAPNNSNVFLSMAGILLSKGDYGGAGAAVGRAQALDPESGHAFILQGRIAAARGQEDEALRLFERAIAVDPGTAGPAAHNQIGRIHFRAGRFDQARDAYEKSIAIDALNGEARDGLANILIRKGDLEAAEHQLASALRFNPVQPQALASMAALMLDRDDETRALEICERALDIAPRYGPAHNNLGMIYRRQGELDRAEHHYRIAIESSPYLDEPHVNLGQLHLRRGASEEAMREFEKALRINRYSKIALANLGAREFNEGRFEQALRLYQRALNVDPDYALVHRHIASPYILKEDFTRAAEHLRRSLELEPLHTDNAQLRQLLAQLEQEVTNRSE